MTLALPARAKVNLDLRIVGRSADGFHDLVSTMQSIDLHDLLLISQAQKTSLTRGGLAIEAEVENSVLKAQSALEKAARRTLPAQFHLHKRIPPGSGLGGASSDAAAALTGLKWLYRLDTDLEPIAAQVGADVPFFLKGGRARAEGRGERLTPLPAQQGWFALAWPRIELSTASVYRAWDEVKGEGPNELRRAAERVDARVADFGKRLGREWQMTGSGSAFFKPCENREEAVAAVSECDGWTAVTAAVGPWA